MTAMEQDAHDLSADALADRVNCFEIGPWLRALMSNAKEPGWLPSESAPTKRSNVDLVDLGVSIRLYRHLDETLNEMDQIVFGAVIFDPGRTALPFGIDGSFIDPNTARDLLSNDVDGGSRADLDRGDRRFSYFLEDARVVELTFTPSLVGITKCWVTRLGGEIPYREAKALRSPLGTS